MSIIILFVLAYLFGSIPFGYLIAKVKQIDIRVVGSGNIGTTNVKRALGLKYAILVGILDVSKGLLPTFLASMLFANQLFIVLIAFASVLGHIFPIFLHFKGGKGVATFAGTLLVIMGIKLFLLLVLVWIICLSVSKIMSLTNLIVSLLLLVIMFIFLHAIMYFYYACIAVVLIWWSHRANIGRLLRGEEEEKSFLTFV